MLNIPWNLYIIVKPVHNIPITSVLNQDSQKEKYIQNFYEKKEKQVRVLIIAFRFSTCFWDKLSTCLFIAVGFADPIITKR